MWMPRGRVGRLGPTYTHYHVYNRQLMRAYCVAWELGSVLFGDLNGKEIQKRGHICVRRADSLCCAAETTSTLSSNYTPVTFKNKSIKKASKTVGSRRGSLLPQPLQPHTHTGRWRYDAGFTLEVKRSWACFLHCPQQPVRVSGPSPAERGASERTK